MFASVGQRKYSQHGHGSLLLGESETVIFCGVPASKEKNTFG